MTNSRFDSAIQHVPSAKSRVVQPGDSKLPPPAGSLGSRPPPASEGKGRRATPPPPPSATTQSDIPPAPRVPSLTPESAPVTVLNDPDSICAELLDELQGPLRAAAEEAVRVLGSDERTRKWIDGQALRRLRALAARFREELQATESRRNSMAARMQSDGPPRASQPPAERTQRTSTVVTSDETTEASSGSAATKSG